MYASDRMKNTPERSLEEVSFPIAIPNETRNFSITFGMVVRLAGVFRRNIFRFSDHCSPQCVRYSQYNTTDIDTFTDSFTICFSIFLWDLTKSHCQLRPRPWDFLLYINLGNGIQVHAKSLEFPIYILTWALYIGLETDVVPTQQT